MIITDKTKTNWFKEHLNLTFIIAYLLSISIDIAIYPDMCTHINPVIWVLSAWIILQKRRNIIWLFLWMFMSPVWLKNYKKEQI